jgi:hypothetical protein
MQKHVHGAGFVEGLVDLNAEFLALFPTTPLEPFI